MRGAPLQVSYLGYPGTMGVDFIDYIIADNSLRRSTTAILHREGRFISRVLSGQ